MLALNNQEARKVNMRYNNVLHHWKVSLRCGRLISVGHHWRGSNLYWWHIALIRAKWINHNIQMFLHLNNNPFCLYSEQLCKIGWLIWYIFPLYHSVYITYIVPQCVYHFLTIVNISNLINEMQQVKHWPAGCMPLWFVTDSQGSQGSEI